MPLDQRFSSLTSCSHNSFSLILLSPYSLLVYLFLHSPLALIHLLVAISSVVLLHRDNLIINGVCEPEGQANNSLDSSQFDNETECEDIHSDSTSTISTKQEAYQRPMCLDTPFLEIDSDNDYIVYNHAAYITNTPIKEHPSHSSLRKKEDQPSHSSKDTACLST
jgi:hypothetical protein